MKLGQPSLQFFSSKYLFAALLLHSVSVAAAPRPGRTVGTLSEACHLDSFRAGARHGGKHRAVAARPFPGSGLAWVEVT